MLELPVEQGSCKTDVTESSRSTETGTVAYYDQEIIDNPSGTFEQATRKHPTVIESALVLHFHEGVGTSEVQTTSETKAVFEGAYMHQTDAHKPSTESSETSQGSAEGIDVNTMKEEAEILLELPLENEAKPEERSWMCLAVETDHQVQEIISRDATVDSTHEKARGLGEEAPKLNINPLDTSLQQEHLFTNGDNEMETRSQENQVEDHSPSPVDFPSLLLDDKSSPGAQGESLQSSSPLPVPSSPYTASTTPPSSMPSSPLIHGTADVAIPLEAPNELPQPKNLQSDSDKRPLAQQSQLVDVPATLVPETSLEPEQAQERKKQIIRNALPNPRHPTAISQKKQHEKLCRPFRPPALVATERSPKDDTNKDESQKGAILQNTTPPRRVLKSSSVIETEDRGKRRGLGAANQFKSPLISRDALELDSSVRLTPTIQMLERKLQILKRAIKVKEDNQEDQLRDLITKWTEAGREVAWELWEIVRNGVDGSHNDFTAVGDKRMYKESWGWEMGSVKRLKEEEGGEPHSENVNDGVEESETSERVDLIKGIDKDEDLDRPHNTLGTMLRHLGIDPQTLGWDDKEEAFEEVTVGI